MLRFDLDLGGSRRPESSLWISAKRQTVHGIGATSVRNPHGSDANSAQKSAQRW